MKSSFLWLLGAALVTVIGLLLYLSLRGRRGSNNPRRRLQALDCALVEGIIDDAEFLAKRKAMLAQQASAPRTRLPAWPVIALAGLIPFCIALLYVGLRKPDAPAASALAPAGVHESAAPATADGALQMSDAIANLERRLQNNPSATLEDWMLLARAYVTTERFEEGKQALQHAMEMAPNNPDVMTEYAEVLALLAPKRIIGEESRKLLEKTLDAYPQHPRAMWLLGIADSQRGDVHGAIARWEAVIPLLSPGSDLLEQVTAQLAEARAGLPPMMKGGTPSVANTAAAAKAATAGAGASLKIDIDIAPELAARLSPTDVLFVFARAPSGPRMPLAMQRLPGAKFPLTVTLDDSMGMMPTLKMSSVPQVIVGARLSKSGVADARSGDLESVSTPLSATAQAAPVKLIINRVVP